MIDRRGLLKTAFLVYLALTVAGLAISWLAGVDIAAQLRFDWMQAAIGLAAVVPMAAVFFVATDLKDRVVELLGPALAQCRWYDLVLLAAMAGIAEELVFRGAIEGSLRPHSVLGAMVLANVLFGAMHPITVTYFLIAAGFGFYFSLLACLSPERNLTAPIVAHAVYDYIGFLLVARDYRNSPVRSFPMGPVETRAEVAIEEESGNRNQEPEGLGVSESESSAQSDAEPPALSPPTNPGV